MFCNRRNCISVERVKIHRWPESKDLSFRINIGNPFPLPESENGKGRNLTINGNAGRHKLIGSPTQ